MAHVDQSIPLTRGRLTFMYNVDQPVGVNDPNRPLDVMLVQFLLNLVPKHDGSPWIVPPFRVDGTFTDTLRRRIADFQRNWNPIAEARGFPRTGIDGRISPARSASYLNGTRTWTIVALNALIAQFLGARAYSRLYIHPSCPPPLSNALRPAEATIAASQATVAGPVRQRLAERAGLRRPLEAGHGLTAPRPSRRRRTTPQPAGAGVATPPSDPGARWAWQRLRGLETVFTPTQRNEIVETMEGTGGWVAHERDTLFLQVITLLTGDPFPAGTTVNEAVEMLRQEEELNRRYGGYAR